MKLSVVMPCYNEADFIRACLESVLALRLPAGATMELFVVDGMSTDGTREAVQEATARHPEVELLDNPRRIQSSALNLAIPRCTGDYLVRLDAHAVYPPDYLVLCLETAVRTGADNVGGIVTTKARGEGYQAAVVQALTTHRFGVGDSGFRTGRPEGPADTVPYGCFRRDVFARVGLFDERLDRAQDYEFNRRILASGGKVWLNPAINLSYYQQPDLRSFLRKQIEREAPFNAYLWYLAPYAFALRHAITAVFAVGVLVGVALSPSVPVIRWVFLGAMGVYFALALGAATQQAARYRQPRHLLVLPVSFLLYHFLHGLGVLSGLARLLFATAPVQRGAEPWRGAGRFRAWPPEADPAVRHA